MSADNMPLQSKFPPVSMHTSAQTVLWFAIKTYLTHPYATPLIILIFGVCFSFGLNIELSLVVINIAATTNTCPPIHSRNGVPASNPNNSSSECVGSFIAPNAAMSVAPMQTNTVPISESRVNGSASMRVAHIELKTRPDYCTHRVRIPPPPHVF